MYIHTTAPQLVDANSPPPSTTTIPPRVFLFYGALCVMWRLHSIVPRVMPGLSSSLRILHVGRAADPNFPLGWLPATREEGKEKTSISSLCCCCYIVKLTGRPELDPTLVEGRTLLTFSVIIARFICSAGCIASLPDDVCCGRNKRRRRRSLIGPEDYNEGRQLFLWTRRSLRWLKVF